MKPWIAWQQTTLMGPKVRMLYEGLLKLESFSGFVSAKPKRGKATAEQLSELALRHIAYGLALEFWQWARLVGKPEGVDLVLPNYRFVDCDNAVRVPGFASVMSLIPWLLEREGAVVCLEYLTNNTAVGQSPGAIRQARYRANLQKQVDERHGGDVTVARLVQNSTIREEEDPVAPKPATEPKAKSKRATKVTNPRHKPAVTHFVERWNDRYKASYPFKAGQDAKHVTWMLAQVDQDLDKLKAIIDRYISDPDQFASTQRHPISLLVSQFQRWMTPGSTPPVRRPASQGERNQAAVLNMLDAMEDNFDESRDRQR